jgi:sortase A
MTRTGRAHRAVGLAGELLVTAGLVVGLFAAYTLVGTGMQTDRAQEALEADLAPTDTSTRVLPPAGTATAYARMRIPRLGPDWQWVVVSGVDEVALRAGPGHYPQSSAPGEIGNMAVAGHRATYGEPFAALDALRPGDEVLIEYEGAEFRYLVTQSFLTDPSDVDVVAAVPGRPQDKPTQAMMTLTTCHPRWGSAERLVVHGELAEEVT